MELHAYKIDDSRTAPMFKVIEKPNDFVKNSKNNLKDSELNKSQAERLYFWSEMNKVINEKGTPFNVRKPNTDHWYNVALGTSEAHIDINLVNKYNNIAVEIYISNNKELYDKLYSYKDEIERKIGL